MHKRLLSTLSIAGLLVASVLAHAQASTWKIDPDHSSVQFRVRHMGVSNVHGSIGNVTGTVMVNDADITKSSVKATMDTSTVWTGTAARDRDLKSPSFFDVAKYPQLSFVSTSLARSDGKLQLTGDLTIKDVTRTVTFDLEGPSPPVTGKDGKTRSGFSASGTLKRSDFSFAPKYPAAIIGNEIKFTIDVELDKQ